MRSFSHVEEEIALAKRRKGGKRSAIKRTGAARHTVVAGTSDRPNSQSKLMDGWYSETFYTFCIYITNELN